MRVSYPCWSLEASEAWTVTEHPECLTLEFSDNSALQFSSARKQEGIVTEQDLFFSMAERETWGMHRSIAVGEFSGIVYEYSEFNAAWIRWFLRNSSILLFVTYNGTQSAREHEQSEVSKVLFSLRVAGQNDASMAAPHIKHWGFPNAC